MSEILYGKAVAEAIVNECIEKTKTLNDNGIHPALGVFRIGEKDADLSYERGIEKRFKQIGIEVKKFVFEENVSEEDFYKKLDEANTDPSIHGILVFRPLPKSFDKEKLKDHIIPDKDVDCCSDLSLAGIFTDKKVGFAPCTAQAVIEILHHYKIDVAGKNVVVIGRSLVIGKPVAMLLLNEDATVSICHSRSKDVAAIASKADILVATTGKMELVNKDYVNEDQVVIDVGIDYHPVKQKLCGDVLFEEVEPIVKAITPVPGGVGSVTTAVLAKHVIEAAQRSI